jgi:alkyl hydroperoxide reductase subunit AhpC
MKRIGTPSLNFRAPALVAGTLTYLGSTQFIGRWTALCFLPYVGIVEPDFLDHQADNLDRIDTTLLIVSSGTRPLHRVWLDRPRKPRTPLLYDPLSRLHRSFGVAPAQIPVRCQTFLIDHAGILRFHLVHDFTDRGLGALHEIVTLSQAQNTGGLAVSRLEAGTRQETVNAEPHLVSLQPSITEG